MPPAIDNLADFYDAAELGTAATWNGTAVVVIFDAPYAEPFGELGSHRPSARMPANSVPGIKHGDVFVIDGTTYKVGGAPQHDLATGEVRVELERQ